MIYKDYIYTEEWIDLKEVSLPPGSLYMFAHDVEARSTHCASILQTGNVDSCFLEIESLPDDYICDVKNKNNPIPLNSTNQIEEFLDSYGMDKMYMDVTGMSCRIAAPLLKVAINRGMQVYVVYTEPEKYKISQFQQEGVNKDLSEMTNGINPLPGFACLIPHEPSECIFVILLGFEGGRFSFLLTDQQPDDDKIYPIVGLPGYRISYPYETYWGNRFALGKTKSWKNVEYTEANSIVGAFNVLNQIAGKNRNHFMKIAPIGTKPHAIGAVLYAIKHSKEVEIIYDNPKRRTNRTIGTGMVLACNVTKLLNDN